ncbi:hypothetical protein Tco_0840867 [Tanacetum coccineum]|uniref:Uncharacterized protein n=1 Tax=Tanacetum coccineum TaxID=301880 RepID=A0ABQ5AV54_9ASTR
MPRARPSLASLLRVPNLRCDNLRCHNQLLVFDALDRRQIRDVLNMSSREIVYTLVSLDLESRSTPSILLIKQVFFRNETLRSTSQKCPTENKVQILEDDLDNLSLIREEDDGISVALDPQTLSSGFCVSAEWEVVFLGGTTLVEVILVKGHGITNYSESFACFDPQLLVEHFNPVDDNTVPTGRVVVPAGRYIVPAGKVILIVSTGRLSLVPTGRVLSPGSDNDSDDASVHRKPTIPQQQRNIQPQIITTISNNNAKFPYLKNDEYEVWAMKMEYWITNNDMNIWKVIQNGNSLKRTGRDRDGRVIILPSTTADEQAWKSTNPSPVY